MGWTDTNNAGLSRSYTHFSQAVDEIVDVPVWSGIRFRTADGNLPCSAGASQSTVTCTTSSLCTDTGRTRQQRS
jgi:hypothetical protein